MSITNPVACSNSRLPSQWCHPTISSAVVPFSCCLQSFPASRSFPTCRVLPSGGQRIGTSASASVLPVNIQGFFSLGLSGLISLQSKGLSRIFSSTTIWKHQFFGVANWLHRIHWKPWEFLLHIFTVLYIVIKQWTKQIPCPLEAHKPEWRNGMLRRSFWKRWHRSWNLWKD